METGTRQHERKTGRNTGVSEANEKAYLEKDARTMIDIRLQTGLIVKSKDGFLVGYCQLTDKFTWSDSPWDAWRTRVRAKARSVAEKTGCEIYLFNPVAGQIRRWRSKDE